MHETHNKSKVGAGASLIGCLVVILLIAGGGVATAGYFGLIPSMSKVLGTNKARDLGIRYANIDGIKLNNSIGAQTVVVKEISGSEIESGIVFEGTKPSKYSVNSEELTALANSPWKYIPVTDVQIKIEQDGIVETSAMLRADRIINFAKSLGYSQEQIDMIIKDYNIPVTNIPVYAKGNFSVTSGQVQIKPQAVEIGRIKLPTALIEKITSPITQGVQTLITKGFPGFSIKNLSFSNGKMSFEGTSPVKQTIVSE